MKVSHALFAAFVVFLLAAGSALADDAGDEKAVRAWRGALSWALTRDTKDDKRETVALYERALALAPTPEHKADTLYYLAKKYEGWVDRENTIATYKRILAEYPESGRIPEVCYALGDLYSSLTLILADTPKERTDQVMSEMTNERAVDYFELAIRKGPPLNYYVLCSKMAVKTLYPDMGRMEEARAILRELVSINPDDLDEPPYMGPYAESQRMSLDPTDEERLKGARIQLKSFRTTARRVRVEHALRWNDPAGSIANLATLKQEYPDSEISEMAEKEIERLSEEVKERLSEQADVEEPAAPPVVPAESE
jgi:tetratricopeptide (TPR) repeat protein